MARSYNDGGHIETDYRGCRLRLVEEIAARCWLYTVERDGVILLKSTAASVPAILAAVDQIINQEDQHGQRRTAPEAAPGDPDEVSGDGSGHQDASAAADADPLANSGAYDSFVARARAEQERLSKALMTQAQQAVSIAQANRMAQAVNQGQYSQMLGAQLQNAAPSVYRGMPHPGPIAPYVTVSTGGGLFYNGMHTMAGIGGAMPLSSLHPVESPPLEDAGLTVGEIIAYRVWRIDDRGYLKSGTMSTVWVPGVPMTGEPDKGVGIHAFKARGRELHDAAQEYGMAGNAVAIGTVALYGTVIECEHGYRAECAMVNSIEAVVGKSIWKADKLLAQLRVVYCGDVAPVHPEEAEASALEPDPEPSPRGYNPPIPHMGPAREPLAPFSILGAAGVVLVSAAVGMLLINLIRLVG